LQHIKLYLLLIQLDVRRFYIRINNDFMKSQEIQICNLRFPVTKTIFFLLQFFRNF